MDLQATPAGSDPNAIAPQPGSGSYCHMKKLPTTILLNSLSIPLHHLYLTLSYPLSLSLSPPLSHPLSLILLPSISHQLSLTLLSRTPSIYHPLRLFHCPSHPPSFPLFLSLPSLPSLFLTPITPSISPLYSLPTVCLYSVSLLYTNLVYYVDGDGFSRSMSVMTEDRVPSSGHTYISL